MILVAIGSVSSILIRRFDTGHCQTFKQEE